MPPQNSSSSLRYRLLLGDPLTAPISIVISPPQSLLALLRRKAAAMQPSASTGGVPQLPTRHRYSVEPLGARTAAPILDAYAPIAPAADTTVGQHIERLQDMPDTVVTDEVAARFGTEVPEHWQRVADQPHRWRRSWAAASADIWANMEPRWQARHRELDREVRRVSMAVGRASSDALLNSLHPRLHFRGGELNFRCSLEGVFTLSDRRLVLVPMIAAGDEVIVSFDQPNLAYIAYPLRSRGSGPDAQSGAQLALIIGAARSAALHALARPHTVGELARHLNLTAATTSYHCDQLVEAGLAQRTRVGRRVLVRRTFRGAELVEVFSD